MKNIKLLVGLTGWTDKHWQDKIREIKNFKLKEVAIFFEQFTKTKRLEIHNALLKTSIKEIPLVHSRDDMTKAEMLFLMKKYKTKYFTIHENHFNNLPDWYGYYKNLYLEMNYDNYVAKNVRVEKIGGFCIDFAHFKVEEEKWSKEFEYIIKYEKSKYFACNHLSGYSQKKNLDLHAVRSEHDFDYLKALPQFIFGQVMAIEIYNSIKEQLKYQKYLKKIIHAK